MCAVATDHQQLTDALSKHLVHQERLCAMQQAQLQQLKRKCECLGRELAQAREAWAESCPGERHGRQGLAPAARAVATSSAVTQLGVQMGTQIHRSTIADWKVRLHVAIQAFNHKLFAELSSRMGAEMLPIDDGAPEATCAFAVHIIHRKSDGTNSSIWRRSQLFVMEVTSWFLPSRRLGNCSTPALFEQCSEHHRAIPDILPMHGGTAVDTYQLQNKQMRSIGVLTEREAATEFLQEPLATRSLRIYLDTDDSVSAQIKAWQLHCGECEDNLHVWSCRSPCWKHQYHLDRKDAYVHADWLQRRLFHSVGCFFATFAKWVNLWRCFFAKISRSWGFARDQETHEVGTAR